MAQTFTSTELRTKCAEILTKVRLGETITITHLGFPVVEMKPVSPTYAKTETE